MDANVTILEIDNQITRRQKTILLPMRPEELAARLIAAFSAIDPDTGELVWNDDDPFRQSPYTVCCYMRPGRTVLVRIYPTKDLETAEAALAADTRHFRRKAKVRA